MLTLKFIKDNELAYSGNVIKVYVNAENLGLIELQQGCANAMYKIKGTVKLITDDNKEQSIDCNDAIVSVMANSINIVK